MCIRDRENADFIENKMSSERAAQLLGENWADIIERSTTAISERFEERMLIYKNKFKRTEKGSITLGWKFELLNKNNGELSGKMMLTEQQVKMCIRDRYGTVQRCIWRS